MNDTQIQFIFSVLPWIAICIGFYVYHRSDGLSELREIFTDVINLNKLQVKQYEEQKRELRKNELHSQIKIAIKSNSLKQLHRTLINLSIASEMWLNKLVVPNYGEIKRSPDGWVIKDIIGVTHHLNDDDLVWELYWALRDHNTGWVLPSYSNDEQEPIQAFSVIFESGEMIKVEAGSEEKAYQRAVDTRIKQGKYAHQTYKTHDGYHTSLMPFNAKVEVDHD